MNQELFNNMIKDVEDSGLELGKEGLMRKQTKELGLQYIDMMYDRYNAIHDPSNEKNDLGNAKKKKKPLRLVDKYLSNFWAIVPIQMIFPNALILHVMREPMDCLFSAFKVSISFLYYWIVKRRILYQCHCLILFFSLIYF